MIKAAIEKILSLGEIKTYLKDGAVYSDRALHLVVPPLPAPLGVETLQGLVDYLEADIDNISETHLAIVVRDPYRVDIVSDLDDTQMIRKIYLSSVFVERGFPFNQFVPMENFIISLQTCFAEDQKRLALQIFLGSVSDEHTATYTDNGVKQTTVAKVGLTILQNVDVPNPVILRPHRSFPEIEPVPAPFILRMRTSSTGSKPEVALFECDGGKWKVETVLEIKKWLTAKLAEFSVGIPVIA